MENWGWTNTWSLWKYIIKNKIRAQESLQHTVSFYRFDGKIKTESIAKLVYVCGGLLTNLGKAFKCVVHDFLIAKLKIYDFTNETLNDFISDRTKKNYSFLDLLTGAPLVSLIGPQYLIFIFVVYSSL